MPLQIRHTDSFGDGAHEYLLHESALDVQRPDAEQLCRTRNHGYRPTRPERAWSTDACRRHGFTPRGSR